jgi:hypothetical protein
MSSETALMPDDPQMVQEPSDQVDEASAALDYTVGPAYEDGRVAREDLSEYDEEQPLNAEEATVLVLYFLQRMRKRVITPRRAVLNNDNIFVVEVDLKDATATVHINALTREVVEYAIVPVEKEPKPLPIPPKRIAMILGGVTALVIFVMLFNFIKLYAVYIIETVPSDYFLIGGAVLLVVAGVIWWRRRG